MSIKILTKNAVENTNIDYARENHFSAGMRSGIVKGAFNEGNLFSSSNNTIVLDSCELIISGHRVIIDGVEAVTLANAPTVNTQKSLFAEIVVNEDSTPSFRLFVESSAYNVVQNNLYKTSNGNGTYQVEIGKFLHKTDGTISDIVRTINVITGGYGAGGEGGNIEDIRFNAKAVSLSSDNLPTANIDYNEDTKEYDLTLGIPKGKDGTDYVLTEADREDIAEKISYVQPNEPTDVLEGTLWVDTDEESDSVTQNALCKINDGINVIDTGLTYSRGVVEVRKIGSIIWVIDSGVYNFTDSFSAKSSRTVFEFTLPKEISNCIHNTNGAYGTTGTICYFPALAYENVNYSTFNCQSYLKRSAIGETYDTFQMVYTGVSSISGGGLCGFHSKMPVIMVQQEGGNN